MAESQGLKVEQFPIDLLYFCRDCPPSDFPQTNMSMETVQWFISILFGVSGKISPNISFALENQRLGKMVRFPNNLFVVKKPPSNRNNLYRLFCLKFEEVVPPFRNLFGRVALGNW